MFYLGVAGATVAGLYFAYHSCYKRQTQPYAQASQSVDTFQAIQQNHNIQPLYDWLQFALNGPFETLPDVLKSAPAYVMADSKFNGTELFQHLQNVPTTTARAQIFQSHIVKLNSKGLPLHCTVLHNLIHLGYILHNQHKMPSNDVTANLTPFFLPLFGFTAEILLTDYLATQHLIGELITNGTFKSKRCANSTNAFQKRSIKIQK